ncbi:MAG: glucose-6-phosphate dehydrogenase [Rhodospirillaceae bacterium]|nr:glucose-6-phosphate dehydrogenase [Rhodospirillaceae bacterium]
MPSPSTQRATLITEPFDMVVFGGRGDLARRKLLPALYELDRDNRLPPDGRIIAVSRGEMSAEDFRNLVEESCREFSTKGAPLNPEVWARFAQRLSYVSLDASKKETYGGLTAALQGRMAVARGFYLATAPNLFGPIAASLGANGLVTPETRLVLEKPLGHDLASSQAINAAVGAVFAERQIYRIDHYLGKETVQNLMVLRFANSLFEPLWNRTHIDHVQITVAETVGVGGRWGYYDGAGALRDMVQNHLLQVLCLTAMEPPIALDADSVRDEKVKVLKSLNPLTSQEAANATVRGQYRAGAIDGQPVPGYLEETDARDSSNCETYVAIRAEIDNWRWAGVPFYLRTGKRLPLRASEIVVQFKAPPHFIYPTYGAMPPANRLIMRLQPNEGVRFQMLNKKPGPGELRLQQTALNLSFADTFGTVIPDAYERLLLDVIRGRPTLFMRVDEVEAAWRWTDSILESWQQLNVPARPYTAGSWGPSAAIALIERDGRTWHEDDA